MFPYIQIVLPSYAVMASVGGICSLVYIFFHLEKNGIRFDQFLKMAALSGVCGFVGSKILFAFTQIGELFRSFSFQALLMLIPQSGLVFYGGLFGVIFALCLYTRKNRELRKRVFRAAVPAFPLFHGFGRIGCFMAGCCYGKKLAVPIHIMGEQWDRIPVQLMESLAEFILFLVLTAAERRHEDCDLLRLYLVCYAVIRFFDEFLRGDAIRGIYFGLSTAQWISLLILGYYSVAALRKRKRDACLPEGTG